jgi:hypothetical protein
MRFAITLFLLALLSAGGTHIALQFADHLIGYTLAQHTIDRATSGMRP